jgi:uncharacterized membrane protein YciS (DUF1049 family)
MKLTKKEQKKLILQQIEQHTLNHSIVIDALVNLLIDKGIILEKEWYNKVELKVKQLENNIKKANTQIIDDDSKLGIYYGPMGEA